MLSWGSMFTQLKALSKAIPFLVFVVFAASSVARASGECEAKCSGDGEVKVDLEAKCMCLSDEKCFQVSIGKDGPKMTTQGHGRIGRAQGVKYQTKIFSSADYDNDALDTGIPENTAVGKWIHKTSNCSPGGGQETLGCIAVPCEHWKDVKEQFGKTLDVCGGNSPQSRSKSRPDPTKGPTDGVMDQNMESSESDFQPTRGGSK